MKCHSPRELQDILILVLYSQLSFIHLGCWDIIVLLDFRKPPSYLAQPSPSAPFLATTSTGLRYVNPIGPQ